MLERIGAALVTPREAVRQIVAGSADAARDAAWLLLARVVAGETPRLARALVRAFEGNLSAALSGILGAASVVLPDMLGIMGGAILLSLLGGRKKPDRTLDIAACAWIPYLTVQLAGALLFTALARPMTSVERLAVDGLGVAWAVLVWILGLAELKRS